MACRSKYALATLLVRRQTHLWRHQCCPSAGRLLNQPPARFSSSSPGNQLQLAIRYFLYGQSRTIGSEALPKSTILERLKNYTTRQKLFTRKRSSKNTSGSSQNRNGKGKRKEDDCDFEEELKKLSLFQRYKKMAKEYWYVLIPVHILSSGILIGSLYLGVYLSDIETDRIFRTLINIGVPERIVKPFRGNRFGELAVAALIYKLLTPIRYAITVGGTVRAIKYLVRHDLIKPVPSPTQLKTMIDKRVFKQRRRRWPKQ